MDTKTTFQKISQKLCLDFDISRGIKHSGTKGTVRENHLRSFLSDGRLPSKYGLGAGEVIGRVRNETSHQCDLIVFDKMNAVTLLYDDAAQVYPIDCVYGIIEAKSSLSKEEFIDALDKIKAFKALAPKGTVKQPVGGGFTMFHSRPTPFGMIFAYSLANNSLDSLMQNLQEWESKNPPNLWPNYICILGTGVILHNGSNSYKSCLHSDEIIEGAWPISLHHKEDSLFQFYCALHDMCAQMNLGPVELSYYYDPSIRVGKYIIRGNAEFKLTKEGIPGKAARFSEAFIEKIVTWCDGKGRLSYREILQKQYGQIPSGLDNAVLENKLFLYNPDNLPGLHELGQNPIKIDKGAAFTAPTLANAISLTINDQPYVIALNGFTEGDFEYIVTE